MRYAKQELVKGWNQSGLKRSEIVVVGSNNLASLVLVDLIAMGFGNVRRVGKSNLPFVDLYKLNPDVLIEEIPCEIVRSYLAEEFIGNPTMIVDVSKNIDQKIICLNYAHKRKIPIISGVCSDNAYAVWCLNEKDTLEEVLKYQLQALNTNKDGVFSAMIASGIIADEVRKRAMPLAGDRRLNRISARTGETQIKRDILLVGAGAIGTFAGISLAMRGANIDIIDFDQVEESNLNRQILFYDSIGRYKSEVMAEKLGTITRCRGIVGKVDEKYKPEKKYDVILSCVDNSKARYWLDWIAYRYNIPLINSGTSISSGVVMPVVRGKTACLDCQSFRRISQSMQEKSNDGSCYEPSIIISNQITGGLVASRVLKVLNDELETIKYNSNGGIKTVPTIERCLEGCEKYVRK